MLISPPAAVEYIRFLPEIILSIFGTLLMVLNPLIRKHGSSIFGNISILGLVAALLGAIYADGQVGQAFSRMIVNDDFANFFRVLVIAIGIVIVLGSYEFLSRERADTGEFHSLILFSVAGQCIMVSSNDLILIFIGLEISSIATYILAGYLRDDRRANEAAIKYFLLGSFATAFFLYGISLIYGTTGSTNLTDIHVFLSSPSRPLLLVGVSAALMLVGLTFKVSGAPFQVWAPDVYQGAPSPVSAFLSAGP